MLFYLHVEKSINIAASFAIAIFHKLEIIRQLIVYDRAAINWTLNFNVTRSSNYAMKYLSDSGGAFKTQSDPMCYLMIGRDQNFIKNFRFFQDDDKDVVCSMFDIRKIQWWNCQRCH